MNRPVRLWIQLTVFLLLVAGAGLLWVNRAHVEDIAKHIVSNGSMEQTGTSGRKSNEIRVVVGRVSQRENVTSVEAIGTGRAHRHVMLISEVPGIITAFPSKAGETVFKGAVVARIENHKARLAVQMAKNKLRDAERLAKRSEQLLRRNVNPQAKVDDAQTLRDRAQIELDQAQEILADHVLRAPFEGIVGIPKVELGDRITANTEIVTLDDRSDLLVEFEFPELYLSQMRPGQKLDAITPSFPKRTFKGVIDEIDSRIDPVSRSISARAKIPNRDDLLRPGMSFQVQITLEGKPLPAIPELALVWGRGQSFVWQVADGKVEKVQVRIVRRLNGIILVEGNLKKSDLVVVEGVQRLRPGRAVKYSLPDPAPTSSLNHKDSGDERKRL